MINKTALSFDDVLMVPKFSDLKTRKETSLASSISDISFRIPFISSPMDTVTEHEMVFAMDKSGGLGVLHRYNNLDDQVRLVLNSINLGAKNVAAAVGVSEDYLERSVELYNAGAKILCIDIAHGHHILMKEALSNIKSRLGDNVKIIAGNVATKAAFEDLSDWGADAVRVGVGGGSICSTRIQTGHGVPTFQSVLDCAASDRTTAIIADGGIKNSGDVVKSLAAGADFVMFGSMLAGTDETPGDVIRGKSPNGNFKVYRGMASREAQTSWRNKIGSVEGISATVPAKGPVSPVIYDIEWGVKSGLSYSGAKNLSELRSKCKFIIQTQSGAKESSTHIIN